VVRRSAVNRNITGSIPVPGAKVCVPSVSGERGSLLNCDRSGSIPTEHAIYCSFDIIPLYKW